MGYKCLPQLTGLVRGEPKQGQKHRSNGNAILNEMGNERYSRSPTLDRSRSHLNEYVGYTSGADCWDQMVEDAEKYRIPVRVRDGTMRERGLRADAVIGWSMIINPPPEMTVGWTADDYDRFFDDSFSVMEKIEPRMFRLDNLRMTATHWDEGRKDEHGEYGANLHIVGAAMDSNGRYCGNIIDARLCDRINHEFPAAMRALGWEIDDADCTDWKRMGKDENGDYIDPEYRAQRKAKAKQNGRSVTKYVSDKATEKWDAAVAKEGELAVRAIDLAKKHDELDKEREALQKDRRGAQERLEELRRVRTQVMKEARREALESVSEEIEKIKAETKAKADKILEDAKADAAVIRKAGYNDGYTAGRDAGLNRGQLDQRAVRNAEAIEKTHDSGRGLGSLGDLTQYE